MMNTFGKFFAIYALASSPFLFALVITATFSLAITETMPHNIDFILNRLDPDPNIISDSLVLLYEYIHNNFFQIALVVFVLTIISLLYIRYKIRGASVVSLLFLLFYGGNVLLFVSHLVFE